jgi:hypothetical protein
MHTTVRTTLSRIFRTLAGSIVAAPATELSLPRRGSSPQKEDFLLFPGKIACGCCFPGLRPRIAFASDPKYNSKIEKRNTNQRISHR